MPVRIMCTISFSTDDEHNRGYGTDGFDDHYKRVKKSFGDGDSQDYLDGCSQVDDYNDEEEDVSKVDDLATFFSSCSLHGANHVFVEDKKFGIRQGLWALVFTMALSAFLLQVADRVIYYLQYDRITMLDEKMAPNMTFPAVTICNYNFIRKSQMSYSDLIFMGPLLGFEDGMAPGFPLAPEPDRPPGSRFSLDEFYNRTRHRMEDMLLECNFRGIDCGPESFREVSHSKTSRQRKRFELFDLSGAKQTLIIGTHQCILALCIYEVFYRKTVLNMGIWNWKVLRKDRQQSAGFHQGVSCLWWNEDIHSKLNHNAAGVLTDGESLLQWNIPVNLNCRHNKSRFHYFRRNPWHPAAVVAELSKHRRALCCLEETWRHTFPQVLVFLVLCLLCCVLSSLHIRQRWAEYRITKKCWQYPDVGLLIRLTFAQLWIDLCGLLMDVLKLHEPQLHQHVTAWTWHAIPIWTTQVTRCLCCNKFTWYSGSGSKITF